GDTVAHWKLLQRLPDELRDVRDLGTLLGGQRERRAEDLHPHFLRGAQNAIRQQDSRRAGAQTNGNDTVTFGRKSTFRGASEWPTGHAVFGSRTSRSPSPKRFKPSTVSAMVP